MNSPQQSSNTTLNISLETKYFPTVLRDFLPIKELNSLPEPRAKIFAYRLGYDVNDSLIDLDEKKEEILDKLKSFFKTKTEVKYYLIFKQEMRIELLFSAKARLPTHEFNIKCAFKVKITKPLKAMETSTQKSFKEVLKDQVGPKISAHLSKFDLDHLNDAQLSLEGMLLKTIYYDDLEWIEIKLVELELDIKDPELKRMLQSKHNYEIESENNRIEKLLKSEQVLNDNIIIAASEDKVTARQLEAKLASLAKNKLENNATSTIEPDLMKVVEGVTLVSEKAPDDTQ